MRTVVGLEQRSAEARRVLRLIEHPRHGIDGRLQAAPAALSRHIASVKGKHCIRHGVDGRLQAAQR